MLISQMIAPSAQLAPYIRHFWILQGDDAPTCTTTHDVYPDGCTTLLIMVAGELTLERHNGKALRRGIYAFHPSTTNNRNTLSGDIKMIDIQLNPGIFYALFGLPVDAILDDTYEVHDLSIPFEPLFLDELEQFFPHTTLLASLINRWLHELFHKHFRFDPFASLLTQLVTTSDLETFTRQTGLCTRQAERKCKTYNGISPKALSKIGRFYHVLSSMHTYVQNNIPYTQALYESHYADQSHFIKEFKTFTGTTPKKFLTAPTQSLQFLPLFSSQEHTL